MGRVVNIVYGSILVILAIESLWTNFVPEEFLPYAVILMGVLIISTRISPKGLPRGFAPHPRSPFDFIRQYLFGAALILIGLASAIAFFEALLPLFVIGTSSGSLILAAIAAIYFLSSFRATRTMEITSA